MYVIDNRDDIFRAGIRMRATVGAGGSDYQAAGIVFENDGVFRDAYYVSKVVINASYIKSFEVKPVLFVDRADAEASCTTGMFIFDRQYRRNRFYGPQPNDTPSEASGVLLFLMGSDWFYYPADRYPSLWSRYGGPTVFNRRRR